MIRVTIAVPEAHISDANQLSLCIGYSAADVRTFGDAAWEDASGNRYAVASTLAEEAFAVDAIGDLAEPPWGADMDAAQAAQSLLAVWVLDAPVEEGEVQPDRSAQPGRISAVIGDDPAAALAALILTRVR